MITISCPKCSAKLRVDPAFQGLTCRCTHCQALLAIPSDAARMPIRIAAEPTGSARGGRAAASSSVSGSQMQDVYNNNSAPGLGVVQAPRQAASTEPLISLERPGSKSGNQTAILAGAAAAGAFILGIGVLLVVLIASKNDASGPSAAFASSSPPAPRSIFEASPAAGNRPLTLPPASNQPLSYTPPAPLRPVQPAQPAAAEVPSRPVDPNNPHTWRTPTVMGQPIAGHTVVLVDSVEQSRSWIKPINNSLLETLSKPGGDERVSVFYIHSGGSEGLPRQPLAPGLALRSSLERLQNSSSASGTSGFYDGLRDALDANPDHVMLITARTKWQSAAPYVLEQVRASSTSPTFSVVSFGGNNADLRSVTEATGGTFESMRPEAVRVWIRNS